MKRSLKPTGYIITLATTTAEYDSCDYAIIRATPEWLAACRQRIVRLVPFTQDEQFQHICWETSNTSFHQLQEAGGEGSFNLADIIHEKETWAWIETGEEELEGLESIGQEVGTHTMQLDNIGTARFTVTTLSGNEEYYTESFNLVKLLEAVQVNPPY